MKFSLDHRSPLFRRFVSAGFWNIVAAGISRGGPLIALILVARIIGPEAFGELAIVLSTISMAQAFIAVATGTTVARYVAALRQSNPGKAGNLIALVNTATAVAGLLLAAALALAAADMAVLLFKRPALEWPLQVGALAVMFGALGGAQTGALSGLEAFRAIAVVSIVSGVIGIVAVAAGAYFGGTMGAVAGFVIHLGLSALINHGLLLRVTAKLGVEMRLRPDRGDWTILWKFGVPALLGGAMVAPTNWLCQTLLVNQPNGFAELGLYHAANQWFLALIFVPQFLVQATLPLITERMASRDLAGMRQLFWGSVKINAAIGLIALLGLAPFSRALMGLYGSDFVDGWLVFLVSIVTAALVAVETTASSIIASANMMWLGFLANLVWALVFVAAALALVEWGAVGLAGARLIAYAVHAVSAFWVTVHGLRLMRAEVS